MKWYQQKDKAAGEKRLLFSWYVYKLFGKKALQLIAVVVSLCTFVFSKRLRTYTRKNLSIIFEYTKNKDAKPTIINMYKNILNYALSLVDKMETCARTFDIKKLNFAEETDKEELLKQMNEKKGIFFICTHIGNIEVLRTFISNPENYIWPMNPHANIFLSKSQCKIFNNFLSKISAKVDSSTYPVEDIDMSTAVEIQEKLEHGDIVFIAGDRVSAGSSVITFKTNFLNRRAEFPSGTFKLAQLTQAPVYFIAALKAKKDTYKIYVKKFEQNNSLTKKQNLSKMQDEYIKFLEEITKIAPLQFYHFYDMFD